MSDSMQVQTNGKKLGVIKLVYRQSLSLVGMVVYLLFSTGSSGSTSTWFNTALVVSNLYYY